MSLHMLVLVAVALALPLAALPAAAQEGGTSEREMAPEEQEFDEAAGYTKLVLIVLDRSGSMSIASRWPVALAKVERIVERLPDGTRFDVILFDRKAESLFGGETLRATANAREKLRARIAARRLSLDLFTDIGAGLAAAFERRPEAVYLISDGVPTAGETATAKLVAAVADRARRARVPVHVVSVLGGTYAFADVENPEGAREVLRGIARETGGKYREADGGAPIGPRDALKRAPEAAASAPGEPRVELFYRDRRFVTRELTFPKFRVAVIDPALVVGPIVMEYALDLGLDVRILTEDGKVFDQVRDVTLRYEQGRLVTPHTFQVVRAYDSSANNRPDPDDEEAMRLKMPSNAAARVEIAYERGGEEFTHEIFVRTFPMAEPMTGSRP